MIGRPDPDALLAGPLGQWLAGQEGARIEAVAKARKRTTWGIGAACLVGFLIIAFGGAISTALQVGFFVGLAGFGWAELAKRPVINRLKTGINEAIAQALDLQFAANVVPGEGFARAKAFGLLPSYDNDRFEDMWSGVLDGRPFVLHEARLTEERGSGKNRRTVTVFEGSILQIGFARRFNGITLVQRDGEHSGWFGKERESITINDVELARCDMVDPTFEDRFTVWTNDQVEGRYLVHPEYVERLLAVESAFAGNNIRALFLEGDLTIVLESGDLFESGSLALGNDRALLERTIDQFATIAELATRLNERERAGFN